MEPLQDLLEKLSSEELIKKHDSNLRKLNLMENDDASICFGARGREYEATQHENFIIRMLLKIRGEKSL
jgi:hypothetical protein